MFIIIEIVDQPADHGTVCVRGRKDGELPVVSSLCHRRLEQYGFALYQWSQTQIAVRTK